MPKLIPIIKDTARVSFEIDKETYDILQKQKAEIKKNDYPFEYEWEKIIKREIKSMKKVLERVQAAQEKPHKDKKAAPALKKLLRKTAAVDASLLDDVLQRLRQITSDEEIEESLYSILNDEQLAARERDNQLVDEVAAMDLSDSHLNTDFDVLLASDNDWTNYLNEHFKK